MYEYAGYSLDDTSRYDLSKRDIKYLDAVIWIVDNNDSIRGADRNLKVSRSALSSYINKELKGISHELYGIVRKIVKDNKRRLNNRVLSHRA